MSKNKSHPFYGKHLTEEHKRKISETLKRNWKDPEYRRKISEARKGRIPWNKGKRRPTARKGGMIHKVTPSTFSKREESILRLRFGIEDGVQHTLEEVGQIFNVTRERIRQIEARALNKLRDPSCRKIFNKKKQTTRYIILFQDNQKQEWKFCNTLAEVETDLRGAIDRGTDIGELTIYRINNPLIPQYEVKLKCLKEI